MSTPPTSELRRFILGAFNLQELRRHTFEWVEDAGYADFIHTIKWDDAFDTVVGHLIERIRGHGLLTAWRAALITARPERKREILRLRIWALEPESGARVPDDLLSRELPGNRLDIRKPIQTRRDEFPAGQRSESAVQQPLIVAETVQVPGGTQNKLLGRLIRRVGLVGLLAVLLFLGALATNDRVTDNVCDVLHAIHLDGDRTLVGVWGKDPNGGEWTELPREGNSFRTQCGGERVVVVVVALNGKTGSQEARHATLVMESHQDLSFETMMEGPPSDFSIRIDVHDPPVPPLDFRAETPKELVKSLLLGVETIYRSVPQWGAPRWQQVPPRAESQLRGALAKTADSIATDLGARVRGVAHSPNGTLIAVSHASGEVQMLDISAPEKSSIWPKRYKLPGGTSGGDVLEFSHDARYLLTSAPLRLWSLGELGAPRVDQPEYSGEVTDAAFDVESKMFALATATGRIDLWQLDPLEQLPSITGAHKGEIHAVAFGANPGDHYLVSAGADGQVKLWDLDSPKSPKYSHSHHKEAREVEFGRRGSKLLTASADGVAAVWQPPATKPSTVLTHESAVRFAHFSPTDEFIVSGDERGNLRIWTAEGGKEVQAFPQPTLSGARFAKDGSLLVFYANNGELGIIPLTESSPVETVEVLRGHEDAVVSAWSSGNAVYSIASNGVMRRWPLPVEREPREFANESTISHLASRAGSPMIAIGSRHGDVDILYLGLPAREPRRVLNGLKGIEKLRVNSDGSVILIVYAGRSPVLGIWDVSAETPKLITEELNALDGCLIGPHDVLVVRANGHLERLTITEPTIERELQAELGSEVIDPDFADDCRSIKYTQDGRLRLRHLGERSKTHLRNIPQSAEPQAYSADGSTVLVLQEKNYVVLRDTAARTIALGSVELAVLNSEGSHLATTSKPDLLTLWHLENSKATSVDLESGGRTIEELMFSHDGQQLFARTVDHGFNSQVLVWHVDRIGTPVVFPAQTGLIRHVALGGERNEYIITAGEGPTRVHTAAIAPLLSMACERAGRELTDDERKTHGLPPRALDTTCREIERAISP